MNEAGKLSITNDDIANRDPDGSRLPDELPHKSERTASFIPLYYGSSKFKSQS